MRRSRLLTVSFALALLAACHREADPVQEPSSTSAQNSEGKPQNAVASAEAPPTAKTPSEPTDDPHDRYRLFRERMKNPVKLGDVPRITSHEESPLNAQQ